MLNRIKKNWILVASLLVTLFFSTYKLSESPTIWMDEGIITQVARNMAFHHRHALQVEPGQYISAGFVTTSYTVTMPIAVSFNLFGVGLVQARAVMVLFMLALVAAAYFLLRGTMSSAALLASMLLLATFAPFYGNGKNVLGEIPGLFYLLTALCFLKRVEMSPTKRNFLLCGIFAGLAVATKPVFILLGPAILLSLWLLRGQMTKRTFGYALIGFAVPLVVWLYVQFSHDSLSNILSIYINPHSTDFAVSFKENFMRFFKESTPLYCTFTMLVWLVSLAVRERRGKNIPVYETAAMTFSLFILFAYLRTVGYYRYFFEAQLVSLIFFPGALLSLSANKTYRKAAFFLFAALIVFQAYQVGWNSWVSVFYQSHRTAELRSAVADLTHDRIFVYKAPEAVLFLPQDDYRQYMEVTKTIHVGTGELAPLTTGESDYVVTLGEFFDTHDPVLAEYDLYRRADRYVVLKRK